MCVCVPCVYAFDCGFVCVFRLCFLSMRVYVWVCFVCLCVCVCLCVPCVYAFDCEYACVFGMCFLCMCVYVCVSCVCECRQSVCKSFHICYVIERDSRHDTLLHKQDISGLTLELISAEMHVLH